MLALGSGCFTSSPATHLLCGWFLIGHGPTGTGLWPRNWGPLPYRNTENIEEVLIASRFSENIKDIYHYIYLGCDHDQPLEKTIRLMINFSKISQHRKILLSGKN